MLRKFCIFYFIGIHIFLVGCKDNDENKNIEEQIRSEIVHQASGIASLEAIYMLTYEHFHQNYITSDDFYIQNDIASMDYGFAIDDKSIKIVDVDGQKILQVRLGQGDVLAIDRVSLGKAESTHEGYLPKDEKGNIIDIDAYMNEELEKLNNTYKIKNLQYAAENLKKFFTIIAEKHNLVLDFQYNQEKSTSPDDVKMQQ